jgi:hypothetical protein
MRSHNCWHGSSWPRLCPPRLGRASPLTGVKLPPVPTASRNSIEIFSTAILCTEFFPEFFRSGAYAVRKRGVDVGVGVDEKPSGPE